MEVMKDKPKLQVKPSKGRKKNETHALRVMPWMPKIAVIRHRGSRHWGRNSSTQLAAPWTTTLR
jgi:hypothetical protein